MTKVKRVVGTHNDIDKAAKILGYAERPGATSDIACMSAAVVIGSLVGALTIPIAGVPLSLSTSVGTLIAGLVCGYLRSVYRTFRQIPEPALCFFNNVGLNAFIAVVGPQCCCRPRCRAEDLLARAFLSGIVVSLVPLIVGLSAGKYIFKFHPGILLGACAGTRSTTAALGAVQEPANSPIPALGYAIPYAVGRIVLALSDIIIVFLMK